ncbi:hypothetical protein A5881_001906 [Enterococcus termitis]
MAIETVKYKNELNRVALNGFTSNEMNLFFSIVSRIKNKEDRIIRFSLNEIKTLAQYKATSTSRFIEDLKQTYTKMLKLVYPHTYSKNDQMTVEEFKLFTHFDFCGENAVVYDSLGEELKRDATMTLKKGYIDISVNPQFACLLNQMVSGFTRFSLVEFTNLKSKYTKDMFRLLKQFRTTGFRTFSINELRYILNIPKSYQIGQIDQKIIRHLKEELSPIFKNLTIKKVYARTQGNKVMGYNFYFTPEKIYK